MYAPLLLLCACLSSACQPPIETAPKQEGASLPPEVKRPEDTAQTIAVAISGGGYRATLLGLGAFQAIHKLGLEHRLVAISGVSGGALAAAAYGAAGHGGKLDPAGTWAHLRRFLSENELARTSVLVELHEAGLQVAAGVGNCTLAEARRGVSGAFKKGAALLKKTLTGDDGGAADSRVREPGINSACFEVALEALDGIEMAEAARHFAAGTCASVRSTPEPQWIEQCVRRSPKALSADLALFVSETVAWETHRAEVARTFCAARRARCLRPTPSSARHPFADLLDALLLEPLAGRSLRLSDLPTRPVIVVGSTETELGELWAATSIGAGLLFERAVDDRRGRFALWDDAPAPRLAESVAGSACYPLFCRPVRLRAPGGPGVLLTDGGIHDNLGILALERLRSLGHIDYDVLMVVDARPPPTKPDPQSSRVGAMLRMHDFMLGQRSATTLAETTEDSAQDGRCAPLHVSVAHLGAHDSLASLKTDLWPFDGAAMAELNAKAESVSVAALQSAPCTRRWVAVGTSN